MSPNASVEPATIPGLDLPEASRRALFAILALGVAFDLAFNGQRPGVSIPLFTLALAASLRAVTPRSFESDVILTAAVVLSVFPALRASQPLIAIDVLAISALLGLAVTQDLGPTATTSITGLVRRGLALATRTLMVPRYVTAPLAHPTERRRTRAALRAAVIAAPILALFATLLASGDRVFARILSSVLPEWNVGNLLSHVVLAIVGAVLVAVLWRSAVGDPTSTQPTAAGAHRPLLGFTEWVTVLAGIDLLFGAFVVVQLAYLFGGDTRVVVTPGLTYAEYARSGFLQLAAAAALTVLVILGVWDAGRREGPREARWFRMLVTAMVALNGVVLVSAVKRLALYEGTFGFTINRFFGYIAIVSIGAVLLVLLAAIWMRARDHVIAGFLLVAFAALLAVNLMGPDRFVAERNVARFQAIGKIDVVYLGAALGDDAIPVVAPLLDTLTTEDARALRDRLCSRVLDEKPEPSWRSANLGRSSARTALAAAGLTPATCAEAPRPARG